MSASEVASVPAGEHRRAEITEERARTFKQIGSIPAVTPHPLSSLGPERVVLSPSLYGERQPRPPRKTYKSCDFCARRKRRCDGDGINRCSLCIEKNQPHCIYRVKPPGKAKPKPNATLKRTSFDYSISGAKRAAAPCDHGTGPVVPVPVPVPASHGRVTGSANAMTLKRCRMSPSIATGLLGMQENYFLDDFFGCLGLLSLAPESIIREAMVRLMIEKSPRQPHGESPIDFGFGQAHDRGIANIGGRQHNGVMACTITGATSDPSKCILWSAISLGALVRGAPLDYVTGYVQRARECLAECFDGGTLETARAYVVMAFLHKFLGDEEKGLKYLQFAKSIISRLPSDEAPKEVVNLLLVAEKSKWFDDCLSPPDEIDLSDYYSNIVEMPPRKEVCSQKDLLDIFLVCDRRVNQAFLEDMSERGVFASGRESSEEEHEESDGCLYPEYASDINADGAESAPRGLIEVSNPETWSSEEPPPAGARTKGLAREFLPELARLSRVAERSGATSGIGGLFYHGNVAYMNAVDGDVDEGFIAIRRCADIVVRYPGTCRFRPHLVHCILAACQAVRCRPVYEQVRDIYNRVHSPGCKPAPPLEEWTGVKDICDHILCRSLQVEIKGIKCTYAADLINIATEDSRKDTTEEDTQATIAVPGASATAAAFGMPSQPGEAATATPPTVQPLPAASVVHPDASPLVKGVPSLGSREEAGLQRPFATPSPVSCSVSSEPSCETWEQSVTSSEYGASFDTNALSSAKVSSGGAGNAPAQRCSGRLGIDISELDKISAAMTFDPPQAPQVRRDFEATSAIGATCPPTGQMPEFTPLGNLGVEDAACDLGVTDQDLLDMADVLFSEGVLEDVGHDSNIAYG